MHEVSVVGDDALGYLDPEHIQRHIIFHRSLVYGLDHIAQSEVESG